MRSFRTIRTAEQGISRTREAYRPERPQGLPEPYTRPVVVMDGISMVFALIHLKRPLLGVEYRAPKYRTYGKFCSTLVHPADVDQTNQVASIQNITRVYNDEQKFPEMDCYTISKIRVDHLR